MPIVIRDTTVVTSDAARSVHHEAAIVVDARRPHLVPALPIVSAWIHNGDEGDVVRRAKEIGRRVWRQLVARYPDVSFPIRLPPPVSGVADTR